MHRPRLFLLALLIAIAMRGDLGAIGQEADSLFFETQVRPILKAHCFHCHGEAEHREAGLDVRLVHLLKKGGDSGPAIGPGSATEKITSCR